MFKEQQKDCNEKGGTLLKYIQSKPQEFLTKDAPLVSRVLRSAVMDMIVDCSLPLSLVEKPGFLRFTRTFEPKMPALDR